MSGDANRTLNYMREHGSVTPAEAYEEYGCYRLSGVIFNLRKAGHDIQTVMHYGRDRHGEPSCHAVYILHE